MARRSPPSARFRTRILLTVVIAVSEEEKNADDLLKKYELFGKDAKGLYSLNQELLARTYVAPTLVL